MIINQTHTIFEDIVGTIRESLLVMDSDLKVVSASRSFYEFFKAKPEETVGQLIYDLGNKQWDIPKLRELLETILPEKTSFDDYEVEHDFATIGKRTMLLNARQIEQAMGKERIILLAIEDITERREIEVGLEKTRKELAAIKKSADEAHEFANSVINTVREPLISLDQNLRVVTVSRSFYDFFKVKPEETVGQLIYDLGNKQWDIPKLRELLETILPEKTSFDDYEVEHDFATIGKRTMLLNARQIEQAMGKERIILLAIEDITERKQLENVLTESLERYRKVFETSTDGILLFKKNGLIISHANRAIEAILGYSKEEFVGRDLKNIGFPDDIGSYQEIMQKLNEAGILHYRNARIKKKTGQVLYADIYMLEKTSIVQCNIRDISERRRSEEDLRRSEIKYRNMMESLTDQLYICSPEFTIEYMNKAMIKHIGRDATGETCYKIIHGLDHQCDWCVFNKVTKGETLETTIKSPLESRHYRVTNMPVQNSNGTISKMSIFRDITQYLDAVAEKDKTQAQLRQAQKMEAIGTLASGISHDFNNILSAVIGYSELALNGVVKGTELEDDLKEVLKAGMRAKDLVKQILSFARQSDEEVKPIQLNIIAKEVLKFIRSSIPTNIKIIDEIISDSFILGSPTHIHQILMNLCTNASQAMEEDSGTLKVSLNDVVIDTMAMRKNLGLLEGDYIEVKVSDTGIGIPPWNKHTIFEPYFTTKKIGEGTGLGLAVVHGIVEGYGGKITVDSTMDKGTVFTIYLPISKKRMQHDSFEEEMLPIGKEHILFVDDEAPISKLGSRVLEQLGYTVTSKTSSFDALELFRSKSEEFDLVITDMNMPNISGDKLAFELMKIRPDIPVVLCTGFSKKISEKSASAIGIKAFAYKPIVKADLAKTVRKVLDVAKGSA